MTDEIGAFLKYAAAFEQAYAADDWALVDVLFEEEIVWSVVGLPQPLAYRGNGRKNTSETIRSSVDAFDRRFDMRDPQPIKGPVAIPGGIHLEWRVTYSREGLAPFELRGEEWDIFRDGQLAMHYELIHNGAAAVAYIAKHDAALVRAR